MTQSVIKIKIHSIITNILPKFCPNYRKKYSHRCLHVHTILYILLTLQICLQTYKKLDIWIIYFAAAFVTVSNFNPSWCTDLEPAVTDCFWPLDSASEFTGLMASHQPGPSRLFTPPPRACRWPVAKQCISPATLSLTLTVWQCMPNLNYWPHSDIVSQSWLGAQVLIYCSHKL